MQSITLNKKDIEYLATTRYEIESPQIGNFEIYRESKSIKRFGVDEPFIVLDFATQLDALLAYKVWEDAGAALVGHEVDYSNKSKDNYEYINAIIIQMTTKQYDKKIEENE